MLNQDKLNTLNEANKLLNQKHAKLGIKPMMLSGTSSEAFRAALERKLIQKALNANSSAREETQLPQFEPRIIGHANESGYQAAIETPSQAANSMSKTVTSFQTSRETKAKTNFLPWIFALVLLGIVFLVGYIWWTNSLGGDKGYNTITISSENRSLAICTGLYSKRSEAQAHKEAVERITGDTVRIIKTGKSYTLQIGESYKRPEDAYLVFDELLKYPLKDLSIQGRS